MKFKKSQKGVTKLINKKWVKEKCTLLVDPEEAGKSLAFMTDNVNMDEQDRYVSHSGGSILQKVALGSMVGGYDWAHLFRFFITAAMIKKNDMNILDVGCGEAVLRRILRRGNRVGKFNYVGVDIRKNVIKKAALDVGKHPAAFFVADIRKSWRFLNSESFDLVVAMEILEHLNRKHAEDFLLRCRQSMKDDARLVVSTPHYGKKKLTERTKSKIKHNERKHVFEHHVYEYKRKELRKLFKKMGFKIVGEYGTGTQIKVWEEFLEGVEGDDLVIKKKYYELVEILPKSMIIPVLSYLYPKTATFLYYVLEKK